MENQQKWFSPALFAAVLVLFFFPFATFSCGPEKTVHFTGYELATGTTFHGSGRSEHVDAIGVATLAMVCAGAGLLGCLLRNKGGTLARAACGAVGAAAMFLIRNKIEGEMNRQPGVGGLITVEYSPAYWLTLLVFILAAGLNVYAFTREGAADARIAGAPPGG